MKHSKKQAWQRGLLIALCVILALILTAMVAVTMYANHLLSLIGRHDENDVLTPEEASTLTYGDDEEETIPEGYTGPSLSGEEVTISAAESTISQSENAINILLVGQDRRPGEGRQRSDSMILCTIDPDTKTITLTSFMRDMYVDIPGYWATKMNHAYAYGGMTTLEATLSANFGISVDGCVEVDFSGFESIVDLVGGVDITMTAAEAEYFRSHYGFDAMVGVNHLDGEMALNYSRLRAIGSDFGRTQRQRNVLTAIFNSCHNLSVPQLMDLLNKALPMLTTNLTNAEILSYASEVFPLLSGCTLNTLRIPADGTYESGWVDSMSVLIVDLEANRQILQETLGTD